MKCANALKIFLLFIITASAVQPLAALDASSMPEVKISVIPAEKKLGVVISNTSQSQTIMVKDQSGVALLSETIKPGEAYAKLLNLQELPADKRYFLIVDNDLQRRVYPFMLTEQGAVMEDSNRKVVYKPVVNFHDGFVDLSYFSGQITNVEVAFYNQYDEEVFSESMDYVIKVERRYTLKSFSPGNYTVKVSTPEETYVHQLEVD